ncbi:MAG: hypothetical protein ACRD3J_30840, partial [Thermoanaerobaculia bacterium]
RSWRRAAVIPAVILSRRSPRGWWAAVAGEGRSKDPLISERRTPQFPLIPLFLVRTTDSTGGV